MRNVLRSAFETTLDKIGTGSMSLMIRSQKRRAFEAIANLDNDTAFEMASALVTMTDYLQSDAPAEVALTADV
jgi:hypothetical protein